MRLAAVGILVIVCAGCMSEAERRNELMASINRPKPRPDDFYLWEARNESLLHGLHQGMTLEEVAAVWGKADEVRQSVIGATHIGTLIYRRYWNALWCHTYPRCWETVHLIFVNGLLREWHQSGDLDLQ